jgi:hypothetical protein
VKQKDAVQACVFIELFLLFLTIPFYALAPIRHSIRGLIILILVDILVVVVMYYIASPGLDKD